MERNQNYVELWGVAAGEPVFSHENHTRRFDKFPLRVERLSGQNDVPVIVASEALLRVCPVEEGQSLRIVGQLRSFNNKSGRLKVAPEHTCPAVLRLMRKPPFELFNEFKQVFEKINKQEGLKQQIIPYFISSHPGCHEADMAELAVKTKDYCHDGPCFS